MFRWLAFLLVFMTALLLFFGNKKPDTLACYDQLNTKLNLQLARDSAVISRYLNSDHDKALLGELNDSPFNIEIFHNDSIAYWNNITSSSVVGIDDNLSIITVGDSLNYGHIQLDINTFNRQKKNIELGKLVNHPNSKDSSFRFRNYTLGYKVLPTAYQKLAKAWAWLCMIGFVFLMCVYLLRQIKQQIIQNTLGLNSLFSLSILLACIKSLHYFEKFQLLFDGFKGVEHIYTSSFVTPSIAHLLINLLIFGITIYLLNIYSDKIYPRISKPWLLSLFTGVYTYFIFGSATSLIEGFVLSPAVNLEIEALMEFDILSFTLILCFSILMMLIFQSTQFLHELLFKAQVASITKLIWIFVGWVIALLLLYYKGMLHVPLWIFTAYVASYTLILDAYTEKGEKKITYLIWWLIMFSGFIAVTLFFFGLKKDIDERASFLNHYYAKPQDKVIQALTSMQDSLVNSDVFTQIASLKTSEKLDMRDLYQFIYNRTPEDPKTQNISIELFDKRSGTTLFNNHFADYYKLKQSYENSRRVGRLIFHNPFEDRYFIRFEIPRLYPSNASWYLFIILQNGNPTINPKTENTKYGYAIFSKGKLIEKNEIAQTTPDMNILTSVSSNAIVAGYSLVISNPSDQYHMVSWKKVSGLIKPISLFSFIFTFSGLMLLLLSLINTRYDILPDNIALKFGSKSSLKTKIQLAIILLIIVTFLIIGAITGFYFKNLIEANQNIKNNEESTNIVNNIRADIQGQPDDEYALTYLNSKLKDISYVHDKELSLYDSAGKIIGSTTKGETNIRIPYQLWKQNQEEIYQNNIFTKVENKQYIPIYLSEDQPLAYIGINHTSYSNSSGNILDFLSTILNAYIFLFLIAGAIAITIANSITQPLTILAEKLKKFKLGKTNEQLEWNSNDEIGTLIHDYNNLTHELERSAGLLAKTERDMAWREMAKQVAHEIKNPLTPMKLSIQYLEKAAKEQPESAQNLIPRISATLIEQIDNLSQIANEFSNFASMPQASNEKIILNEIVETIHDLFRKRDDMEINMIEPIDDLYVFADKNHLVRILNNLLKNAIQAIPENRRGKIEIELKRHNNDALIRISDNGTGIPDHMKDKVFTPNFTTKSSGTGLGLAISANMIESFNGRIYFETKPGFGTDFFIAIPLMRLDDYFNDENRVSLD